MSNRQREEAETTQRLTIALSILFVVALVMGPGPGMRLVDPGPNHEGPAPTFAGLPVLYAWGLLWFSVQVGLIAIAYVRLWDRDGSAEHAPENE